SEAEAFGEAADQLTEGFSYEYKLPPGTEFTPLPGIICPSRSDQSRGRITPGIFVGLLSLQVLEATGQRRSSVKLEVRSVKTSYRDDYRVMLKDITEHCTDLLMQHSSPVTQTFETDYDADASTIYQRFAFVKSIVDSDAFQEAIHRVITSPVTAWAETEQDVDIRNIRRMKSSHLRQFATRSNRVDLPSNHPLRDSGLASVPARITVAGKIETVDTPENRFVKHMLETYLNFCVQVRERLKKEKGDHPRAYSEANALSEKLEDILNHDFFKSISPPTTLPLNSPVLQRKEGYRELLRGWLMFDLAAKLVWHGGEDVYGAGKRDVAVLYEYWLFFKLLELLKELFSILPESTGDLIETTADGIGLKLKAGKYTPLKGIYEHPTRKMHVEFSYNRTFSGDSSYPAKGSWSRQMRPDYTLTLWPFGFTQDEAELQETIVHIHFDAKYRIEGLAQILGEQTTDEVSEEEILTREKTEQRSGKYKRADLLKMHAYKDAIRRTVGAYVLYPGKDGRTSMQGFHEIIPGLGAFGVRPSSMDDGTKRLQSFISEVVDHLVNRASQRDSMTYQTYKIHESKPDKDGVREAMPELDDKGQRSRPPAEVSVLVGYVKDANHHAWINSKGLYNFRTDGAHGSIRLSPEAAGASYLLLHEKGKLVSGNIWQVIGRGPRIFSRAEIMRHGYCSPGSDQYLVYEIKKCADVDFNNLAWDVRNIPGYSPGHASAEPFALSLTDLMKAKVQD
ncbi:MAG: DUF2357 domain-containing protein, partial [Mariprofundus sp.]|nr:DUF2357 domain-containing protein [Mariprofundus sp.]